MKITMTAIIERKRARIYTKKAKKLRNVFIYKKLDTFQKTIQFPFRFYIQKTYTQDWRIENLLHPGTLRQKSREILSQRATLCVPSEVVYSSNIVSPAMCSAFLA